MAVKRTMDNAPRAPPLRGIGHKRQRATVVKNHVILSNTYTYTKPGSYVKKTKMFGS